MAQLGMLIYYHLLRFRLEDGYVDTDDDEVCKRMNVDERTADAIALVRGWSYGGEWCEERDEWVGDALVALLLGKGDIDFLPWRSMSEEEEAEASNKNMLIG